MSPNPMSPPPQGLIGTPPAGPSPNQPFGQLGSAYGQGGSPLGSHPSAGFGPGGGGQAPGSAYANYQQQTQKNKSAAGWWIGGGALLLALLIIALLVVPRFFRDSDGPFAGPSSGQASQDACPPKQAATAAPDPHPQDGRVHGGPVSFPALGTPWGPAQLDDRVPFGRDTQVQQVLVESDYDGNGASWVASILVAELRAGDGFFTPEQGSQIVVKCILGEFYGDAAVNSNVKVNQKATIDGHDAWIVESQLSFDIEGLKTKGELLIVAIVEAGATSGLYYASIPDTTPELVQPARDALQSLKVDG